MVQAFLGEVESLRYLVASPLLQAAQRAGVTLRTVKPDVDIALDLPDIKAQIGGKLIESQKKMLDRLVEDEEVFKQINEKQKQTLTGLHRKELQQGEGDEAFQRSLDMLVSNLDKVHDELVATFEHDTAVMRHALPLIPEIANRSGKDEAILDILRSTGHCSQNKFLDIAMRVLGTGDGSKTGELLQALMLLVVLLAIRRVQTTMAMNTVAGIKKLCCKQGFSKADDPPLSIICGVVEGQLNTNRACIDGDVHSDGGKIKIYSLYLAFEFACSMVLRDKQVICVKDLVADASKKQSVIRQMIMGFGKTQVITPLICLLLGKRPSMRERGILVLVPPQLLDMSREVLRAVLTWVISSNGGKGGDWYGGKGGKGKGYDRYSAY